MKNLLLLVPALLLWIGPGTPVLGAEDPKKDEPKKDDKTYFKTYQLQTTDVDLTTQVLKELLGEKRQIVHHKPTNQLFISGTAEEHKQIEAILAEINVPSPNVRVDVTTKLIGTSSDTGVGIKKASGDVAVTKEGTKVRYKFSPEAHARSGSSSSLTQQTLVMQSGKEASLMVGQEVPFLEYFVYWGKQWGLIERELLTERVGAFLDVRAQVIGTGPMISVTLVPEIRTLVGEKRQRIHFTKVSTSVTVKDGETITIGGGAESQEFFDKFLVGFDESGTRKSLNITLTPRIIKPDGTPARKPAETPAGN